MSKKRAVITFLVLLFVLILVAIVFTLIRGGADMRPIDPKLTVGLTAITFINVVKTFGMIVGLNVFVGFLIKKPASIVFWIPIGAAVVTVAHHQFGDSFGLMSVARIGWLDAFLMYVPAVGLASLVGGLLGNWFQSK
ncbi:MAG TPA: hypothetical protein DD729_10435 [Rhodobacteraceae bacterium]|nr:hypothetical protein [Paracoccaceae bacterium]